MTGETAISMLRSLAGKLGEWAREAEIEVMRPSLAEAHNELASTLEDIAADLENGRAGEEERHALAGVLSYFAGELVAAIPAARSRK